MKKLIIFSITCLFGHLVKAQSAKFAPVMKANIMAIDTSFRNPENLLVLANTFERIASAEKSQWLPYYYAALMQVNYTFVTADRSKTDMITEKAEALINKADSLSPANSEISTVRSMIASSRLMVDPMTRYMEYGPISAKELELAIVQDPSNPRPLYLKGQGLKYTPEQFGGGCKSALPFLEQSLEKYQTFKPSSDLHPNWGMERVKMLAEDCKK